MTHSGLYAVTQDPSIIQGYEKAILTPNIMEFKYLSEKMVRPPPLPPFFLPLMYSSTRQTLRNLRFHAFFCAPQGLDAKSNPDPKTLCPDLAKALGHVTILQKGETGAFPFHLFPFPPLRSFENLKLIVGFFVRLVHFRYHLERPPVALGARNQDS